MSVADRSGRSLRGRRILFVLPTLGLAGAERQAFLLAKHLRRAHDADARLVSVTPISSMAEECAAAAVPYEFFELRHSYRSRVGHVTDVLRFAAFLRRRKVDLVLPYCMFQNVLSALTWRLGGASVCVWNQRDEGRSRLEPWIERAAIGQVRRFISNSHHGAHFLKAAMGVRSPIDVVPNGLEWPVPETNRVDWRQRLGLPGGAFTACMVANLHGKKDHRTLIHAWRDVVDKWEHPGSPHLLLAGAFHEQYEPLVQQVRELSLQSNVHFLDAVADVHALLRDVNMAVFSSFNEGVPNAVLEAMAHGLAVVATDCDGLREAVGSEGSGLLVRPKDAADLAEKVRLVAGSEELRIRYGESGRRRVRDQFGVERMTERMTEIIVEEFRCRTARH